MAFYTERKRPKENIDLSRHRIVPVLASYNVHGECVPVYFRYFYEDGTYTDIAIDRVVKITKTVCAISYSCDITVCDVRRRVVLTFHPDYGKWSVLLG